MSLEQAIADNTAAIQQLVAISTKLHDLRADAIEKVSTAAVSTKATKKADDKPAADAGKTETKANISTGGERVDPADDRAEEIKQAIATYVGGSTREEERAARKEKVKALLNHEKIVKPGLAADRKPSVTDIKPDAIDLFMKNIAGLTTKGDITEAPKPADKPASDDLDI